jgi:hypothetical protein
MAFSGTVLSGMVLSGTVPTDTLVSGALLAAAGGGNEAVAVAVSVLGTAVVLALGLVVVSLLRTVRALRTEAELLAGESRAVIAELRAAIDETNGDLARVDHLLEAAESVTASVDSASRLAYSTFSRPVIRVLALGSGIAAAVRRLTGGRSDRPAGVRSHR